jgi:hypothetical protein
MDIRKSSMKVLVQVHEDIGTLGSLILGIIVSFIAIALMGMYPMICLFIGFSLGSYLLGYEVAKSRFKRYSKEEQQARDADDE